jgi:exosome complex protein LRP1
MDTDIHSLVDDLTSNIDDLEESLAPLLQTALSQSTSKLPLLDKAKLYVLATYAIESILFSSLRLNGIDAKAHPVFKELTRVKEYFGKIKSAETSGTKRNVTLDKEAASRFVKHGLAGNDKYDRERAERIAKEKAGAKRKLEEMSTGTHTRFDAPVKKAKAAQAEQEVRHVEDDNADEDDEDDDGESPHVKGRRSKTASSIATDNAESTSEQPKKKKKKKRKKSQKDLEERRAEEMK